MVWCFVLILAVVHGTLAVNFAEVPKDDLDQYCTNFFYASSKDLDEESLLGVWYEVENQPKRVICVNFELLTDQYQQQLVDNLNIEGSLFDKYSLVVSRNCPGVTINVTEETHVWEKIIEYEFLRNKALVYESAVIRNDTVHWNHYKALVGRFSFQGDDYLGVIEVPNHKFVTIMTREREDEYDNDFLYYLYSCFYNFFETPLSFGFRPHEKV